MINLNKAGIILSIFALSLTTSCSKKEQPMKMNEPRNIRGVVSYNRSFNDLNKLHLDAAQKIGIKPIDNRDDVPTSSKKLSLVETCAAYHLDSLTHSLPYLVPQANNLLNSIAQNFQDSLLTKGLNPYKVIVTSVLRTTHDVKRLQKKNVNASLNSAHFYGTTFDISWKRFQKMEDPKKRPLESVGSDTLKMVLSEVLRDLKKDNKCYIKHEIKQGCFHITAR